MVTLTFLQLSHHIISGIDTNSLTAVTSATTAPSPNTESQESDSAVTIAAVIVVLIIAAMLAAAIGLVVILVIFRRRAKRTGTDVLCNDSQGNCSSSHEIAKYRKHDEVELQHNQCYATSCIDNENQQQYVHS